MTLPVPRLDDRTMQDIVDEAKSRIHRYCPDWTDHNVSDPGVALIELYAWMTEMMLYRLNQVPDRLYLKFLELMGIPLQGASAAVTDLVFRLTSPQAAAVRIPAGTQVATERLSDAEPVVFQSTRDLLVQPPELITCVSRSAGKYADQTEQLLGGAGPVVCFGSVTPGDAIYFGFAESLGANLVRFTVV
ncbi:MAG: putative baseplate assembly protein, partial [Propionibacteriaceae bacterium]|nr:putative baseplate assembly protein [Propionibacteriaceae bacterium]